MIDINIYNYTNYKIYLSAVLPITGESRGSRVKLAEHLKCNSAFISMVLKDRGDFSLEQAFLVSQFLNHSENDKRYFLLLVQTSRAGSKLLKEHFIKLVQEEKKKFEIVANVINVKKGLEATEQMTYYSAWYYSAIHVLLSIKKYQSKNEVAKYLGLSLNKVEQVLFFLVKNGLAIQEGQHFRIGEMRIHLGPDSPMISKHHNNWRLRAMQSLEQSIEQELHYSSVVSLAEEDVSKIKNLLLAALKNAEAVIKDSVEEELHSICIDFFKV